MIFVFRNLKESVKNFYMAKKLPNSNFRLISVIFLIFLIVFGGIFFVFSSKRLSFEKGNLEKLLPPPAPYPQNSKGITAPDLTAKSAVVIDVDSSVVLFDRNVNVATSPASTTKIMTALVSLENYRLDQIIEVKDLEKVEGQKMKLFSGEKITVENLLYGLLVASANDAALVLARNFPNGEAGFIWAMNQKVKELGLTGTNYKNPVGYDDQNHYSTALDLARLAIYAMKNSEFAKITGTQKITIYDVTGTIPYPISNVNTLVGKLPGVKGVKTGWTQQAGECLVTFIEQDGRKIVIVVLGSEDRFKETEELIKWVYENFTWNNFTTTP